MVFSFCKHSYSCITVWWRPEFRVETSCNVIKLLVKYVLFWLKILIHIMLFFHIIS